MQEIQDAVAEWERRNFPDVDLVRLALLVCEEAGELAHVVLKQALGIRQESSTDAHLRDAIGDIAISLMVNCAARGWSFEDIVRETADVVLAREWRPKAVAP